MVFKAIELKVSTRIEECSLQEYPLRVNNPLKRGLKYTAVIPSTADNIGKHFSMLSGP